VLPEAVVDFLDLHAQGWPWPTFNPEDSFLLVGVLLLLIASRIPTQESSR
jgi:signal peptidase II